MAVSGNELSSIDFTNLIGGPLNAVIEAQAKSAITTANFIKEVGFYEDGKVINVDFGYKKSNPDGRKQEFKLTVPFLTMLPIPYIKVDKAIVEFNAKITSTTESSSSDTFSVQNSTSAGGGFWFASAKIKTKTSYQKQSASTNKETRSYDMHVKVTATNADMPEGTSKILDMIEAAMTDDGGKVNPIIIKIDPDAVDTKTYRITEGNTSLLNAAIQASNDPLTIESGEETALTAGTAIESIDLDARTITFDNALAPSSVVTIAVD